MWSGALIFNEVVYLSMKCYKKTVARRAKRKGDGLPLVATEGYPGGGEVGSGQKGMSLSSSVSVCPCRRDLHPGKVPGTEFSSPILPEEIGFSGAGATGGGGGRARG